MSRRAWAALKIGSAPATDLLVGLLIGLTAVALLPPGRLPYRPGATFSDVTLAHWPNAHFLRESVWQYGQWPLWRPTEMLGAPFAANLLAKVYYPPQWLTLVPGPSITLALDLLVYAHLIFGALGLLTWARAAGLSDGAGAFAALGYALTPKVIAHLGAGHLDLVYAMAWAGWFLWALERCARAPTWSAGVTAGVVAAMMALADMRLAAYALGAGFVYATGLRWKAAALGLATLVLGLLTAVYTIPLAAIGPSLTRAAITPGEAGAFSLPPAYLLGLLIADAGGHHEWMTYLGLPALALALLALRTRRRAVWVLWGVTLLAALYALGEHTPLYRGVVKIVPLLTWLRVPSRAWFVVALSVTTLSAFGAQSLLDGGIGRAGRLAGVALAAMGLAVGVGALVMGLPALIGLGLALLGTGAGWLLAARWRGASLAVLGLVLLASLVALDATLIEGRRESDVFRAVAPLPEMGQRVYSPSFSILPHEAELAGSLTLHGVNPFQLRRSADTINRAAGVAGDGYSITAPSLPADGDPASALRAARPDVALLAALSVGQVVSDFAIEGDALRKIASEPYLYEVPGARPLAYLAEPNHISALDDLMKMEGSADLKALTPNRLLIDTQAAGDALLVVTQAWTPGWRARVDGRPAEVVPVGGAVQGVSLPAGQHHVELIYRPAPDLIGLSISSLSALALILWAAIRWRASR